MSGAGRAHLRLTDRPLPEALQRIAAAHPGVTAFAVDGGDRLDYASWARRSDAAASGLRELVTPGSRVALLFDGAGWIGYAVAYMAVLRAGAVAVPVVAGVGTIELARILRDSGARAVIGHPDCAPGGASVPLLELGELERAGVDRACPPAAGAGDDEVAEILYDARPLAPAVAWPRTRGALRSAPWPLLHAFPPGTRSGQEALRGCLMPATTPSLIVPEFDADRVCRLIAAAPERACALDPAAAVALLESGAAARHDLSRLRHLLLAGGPIERDLIGRLAVAFPGAGLMPLEGADPTPAPDDEDDDDDVAPVTASQVGMLWQELFAPGTQNLPGLARRFRGALDVDALARALAEIVRRHAPLRTGFEVRHGRPVQVIRRHYETALPVRDLTSWSEAERDEEVARTVSEAGRRPFDLIDEPLFAPVLLRLAGDEHILVIRTHHLVFDDWSVGVFRRQLGRLYRAFAAGEPSPLPEPRVQFADFARRRRDAVAGARGDAERAFWERELAGAPLSVQLPVADPATPAGTPQPGGNTVALALGTELHERLRTLARAHRVTVHMAMLAAFGVLVGRYTGQDDLVLATVVANRNETQLEGLIGCFTKKVPLRLRLSGDPTFIEALSLARAALLGSISNQDLPFESVVQATLGPAAAAHGLVPQLAVMFQGVTPQPGLELGEVESAGLDVAARAGRTHFAAARKQAASPERTPWGGGLYAGTFVIVSVDESDPALECTARGAFHAPAARELLERFRTLLADGVADPDRPISELKCDPVLPARVPADPDGNLRGFRVEPARIEAALQGCDRLSEVSVVLERDENGAPQVVAYCACDGPVPTVEELRAYIWRTLPGYACPARLVVSGGSGVSRGPESPERSVLSATWAAEARAAARPGPDANYWQDFTFPGALVRAREAGLRLPTEHVVRNRTLGTLAAAVAAERSAG
jgi:hypothetical protein